MSKLLTEHVLSIPTTQAYSKAINHPFLRAAGERTLGAPLLALWLSQDRLYAAHAYPRFIGSLISKIPFSADHGLDSPEDARNQRILKLLAFCLENVVREAGFFRETAERWGLDIEGWKERRATREYTAEMARVASLGTLEEGLVFLWAMEKVYLDAWSFVRDLHASITAPNVIDVSASNAISSFVANWTSPEFVAFVDTLAGIVNDLGIKEGTAPWKRAEQAWGRVVELEVGFWPNAGEEITGRE